MRLRLVVVIGLSLPWLTASAGPAGAAPDRLAELAARGARIVEANGVRAVSGAKLASGSTPETAARAFVARYSRAFAGAGPRPDLRLVRSHGLARGALRVYCFDQILGGIPVVGATLRVVVRDGEPYRVVHAAGRLAPRPAGGIAPPALKPGPVRSRLRETASFGHLPRFGEPGLVVFHEPSTLEEPRVAWSVRASDPDPARHECYTLFVDARTGALLHVRDEVHRTDITGDVAALATPGTLPDVATNPPVPAPLGGARVRVDGGASVFAGESGSFSIPHDGGGAVILHSELVGPWVRVFHDMGDEIVATQTAVPPAPASLVLNGAPAEETTAQVNGFVQTMAAHDFLKDRLPELEAIDLQIPCNVNLDASCNAFFTTLDLSINFFTSGSGCVNTAYSSVVAHEYGHFVVNRLGLDQGAFGEGYGDTLAILLYDDPVVGRDFHGPGQPVRDTVEARVQYPCSGEIHYCGQLLSGCFWAMRENLVKSLGGDLGRETVRQLFADWSAITVGGSGTNSAHPITAIEVLTVDDDDGDLGNGSPHFTEICAAFEAHGIACPELVAVEFTYPEGIPDMLVPGEPRSFPVVVRSRTEEPVPGSGKLWTRTGADPFVAVPLEESGPNTYVATLGARECPDRVDLYLSVDLAGGGTATDPADAPGAAHRARAHRGEVPLFEDSFERDRGWTVDNVRLSGGAFERGVPAGDGSRGDPEADADGSGSCYLTENAAGNSDVDGGPTRLVSPPLDFADGDGVVRYAFWLFNDDGDDALVVEASDDAGATWTPVVEHRGGNGGWQMSEFVVSDHVVPTDGVRVRFSVADAPNNSITEAAVDAFAALRFDCEGTTDCNGNGVPDEEEIASGDAPDCNGNGIPDECDVDSGRSPDVNRNGIPDECEDAVAQCAPGGTGAGCGQVEAIVSVNGDTGGEDHAVEVEAGAPISFEIAEPPAAAGDGRRTRACLYLFAGEPALGDVVPLPKNLGSMCFGPLVLATREPDVVLNALGAAGRLGEHTGPGDPPVIPDAGVLEFHRLVEGIAGGASLTVQGIVEDGCSRSRKPLSVTNGVVVRAP